MQIEIDQIHYTYPDGTKALNGISLKIQTGEMVALVGQNGSGKSTLARHLNGLLRPTSGSVRIGGWQTSEHNPAQMARRVAYAFQNPDEQLFHQQVWGEVAFGPQNLKYSSAQIKEYVQRAISWLGISEASNDNPRDLGYSARKRVAMASAIAMQSPIIIFDEPTAGLDAKEQNLLKKVITALRREEKTVIVISHDIDFLAENMDRFILMKNGQIVLDSSVEQFFTNQNLLIDCGLDAPQITRLSKELRHTQPSTSVQEFIAKLR